MFSCWNYFSGKIFSTAWDGFSDSRKHCFEVILE